MTQPNATQKDHKNINKCTNCIYGVVAFRKEYKGYIVGCNCQDEKFLRKSKPGGCQGVRK